MFKSMKKVSILLVSTLILNLISMTLAEPVYAQEQPNVIVYIHGEGAQGGPIFNQSGDLIRGLWEPGAESTGTLRIINNYSERIRVNNLGISMKLYNSKNDMPLDDSTYREFAQNMKLTIKRGSFLIFTHTIFEGSFYEMLYEKGNPDRQGYQLKAIDRFDIGKNKSADLQYTVRLDENAGNNMQGLKAFVTFMVNTHENPELPDDNNNDDNDDDGKDKKDRNEKQLIEEPVEVIPDISGHWAHDCIKTLLEHGVIEGYPDGTIRPENFITRAEAAALISRALKLEEKEGLLTGYIDPIPKWSRGYIMAASEKRIFKGYPGKTFKANKNILREEIAAVLIRAFNKYIDSRAELDFVDKGSIDAWALEYVKSGVGNRIIEGYPDKSYRAKANITRAEAFTMICKLMGLHDEHN